MLVPTTTSSPDVFLSYAREDREVVRALATALADAGLSVWWDREIAGGQHFADVIAERLAAARVVLVLWSQASVVSDFVRDEASRARDAGKLLPLRIQEVGTPLGSAIHTLDLIDWDGDRGDPAWAELLANLERTEPGVVPQPTPTRPPRRRWWRPLALAALLAALAAAGGYGIHAWRERQAFTQLQEDQARRERQAREDLQQAQARREQQALTQFQDGLSSHFARDRNLQAARNAYLNALRSNPELGRAHYYLGHVYALLLLPGDAHAQFALALRFESDLDDAQRKDARVQVAAFSADPGAAPVARAVGPEAVLQRRPALPRPDDAEVTLRSGRAPAGAPPRPPKSAEPAQPTLSRIARRPSASAWIEAQVDALFEPPGADPVVQAATALALDPGMMADAMPLALQRSLASLAEPPAGEAAAAGASNTLQLLLGASPATLNAQRTAVLRLLDAAAPLGDNQRATAAQLRKLLDKARHAAPPVVYIQIADESQLALAQRLAERFRASGYAVPGIENVGARAPSRSEVRAQGASVLGWGRWLAKVVGETGAETAPVLTLRGVHPAVDTFEVWLDKDLCRTRRVPACGG